MGGARSVEAEAVLRESLSTYRREVPENDARLAPPLSNLGGAMTSQGRAREAEPLIRQALAIQEAATSRDDPIAATIRRTLGVCLAALGRDDAAEAMLLESYRILTAAPYARRELASTASELATFYESRGRGTEATRFRKLAASVP
jgi:eukaryotic-like serine/threonine-protein kinase